MEQVKGRCPACGHTTLFVAAGGYLTCSLADCPNPTALAGHLDQEAPSCVDHPGRPADWRTIKDGQPLCGVCVVRSIKAEHERVSNALAALDSETVP